MEPELLDSKEETKIYLLLNYTEEKLLGRVNTY